MYIAVLSQKIGVGLGEYYKFQVVEYENKNFLIIVSKKNPAVEFLEIWLIFPISYRESFRESFRLIFEYGSLGNF